MTAVSNTSPLRYLIAAGQASLLAPLFGKVVVPRAVESELTHRSSPDAVRRWMAQRPTWLEVHDLPQPPDPVLSRRLDNGEAEAIDLAIHLRADVLVIDKRRGRQMATKRGLCGMVSVCHSVWFWSSTGSSG